MFSIKINKHILINPRNIGTLVKFNVMINHSTIASFYNVRNTNKLINLGLLRPTSSCKIESDVNPAYIIKVYNVLANKTHEVTASDSAQFEETAYGNMEELKPNSEAIPVHKLGWYTKTNKAAIRDQYDVRFIIILCLFY